MSNRLLNLNCTKRPTFAILAATLLLAFFASSMSLGASPVLARDPGVILTDGAEGTPAAPAIDVAEPTTVPVEVPVSNTPLSEGSLPGADESTSQADVVATEPPAFAPQLTWSLDPMPECRPETDATKPIASGGSLTFDCTSSISLDGVDIAPLSISIDWNLRANADGGWRVAVLPPLQSEWIESIDGVATAAIGGLDHGLTGETAEAFEDREIELAYRLRITRAACDLVPREVRLEHDVSVAAAGAVVNDVSALSEPLRLSPALGAIPDPDVSFDGPLNFGSVGTTASGPVESARTGTLAVTVRGLDQSCGEWNTHLVATPLIDERGHLLPGASLVLVAVDDRLVPDGGCDLTNGCDAVALLAGPNANANEQITLTIELRIAAETPLGAFGTTIDATLNVRGTNEQ